MDLERMCERFVRLCEIPSPTGSERQVADAVSDELRALGAEVVEDDRAGAARAGAGNLLARVPGESGEWVMLCAHLDTVPHGEPIEVEEVDGVFRSRGETILGADNKAAVTVLIELVAELLGAGRRSPVGIELLLTVAEEQGLRGAHAFDLEQLRAHATPIGEIITAAPTYKKLNAEFFGIEAHAGLRPEAGRSAIEAASTAVATMDLGRLDPETTANVGVIAGGSAPNVVAASCRLEAEARSVDRGRAEAVIMTMVEGCQWAAGERNCDVDIEISELFRGYRLKRGSRSLQIARGALERCGIEPREISTGGGSDANAFRDRGFDALLVANGTEANHTPEETVRRSELARMLEVCRALVEETARC
jgi:tripeptide aminopeptidase